MSCFHPILAWTLSTPSGKNRVLFQAAPGAQPVRLPCGKCIGCRLERSRQWAVRALYEASLHKANSFITLTYAEAFLPELGSLVIEDLQKFFKRLRKAIFPLKVRYLACGEYGEHTHRPHYHACLFGYDFPDREPEFVESEDGIARVERSKQLQELWPFGNVAVGDVNFSSAAYVARYCLKKVNGAMAEEHYAGRLPEFLTCSRRPGLAADWFSKFGSDVFPNDLTFARGKPCKPPRFFEKCLEKVDPLLLKFVKEQRKLRASEPLDYSVLRDREKFREYVTAQNNFRKI